MAHNILLIDDDEAILEVFRILLTNRRYAVDCAQNLEDAEGFLDQNVYSVIISDLNLGNGELGGLHVLELIRRLPQKPLTIVCSGSTESELQQKTLGMGADLFLAKPYSFKTFLDELDDQLTNSSARSWPVGSMGATEGAKGVQHSSCR
jgi:DNA-binding response OmpR family regulator